MVVAAIDVERIRTLGAGCPSAGSQAGGQVAQGRGGHIDAGRVDKHAEAPGRTGDLGREPVYKELLHVRTPTPTSTTRPRTQAGKGSLTGMRRMVTRSAWYPGSAADQSALTALATRLTLIHEEGRTGRCPRVLTDER